MKILASLTLTLFCACALAGPGDGPIVPWPTSLRGEVLIEDIQGSWIGYSHNTTWHVDIHRAVGLNDVAVIRINSTALFTHQGQGLLNAREGLFWGDLVMDEYHRASIYLYKNNQGMTLRLGNSSKVFHDIKLYKANTGTSRD